MQLLSLSVFFVGYGFAVFFFLRWLARIRVGVQNQFLRIGLARRMWIICGIVALGFVPLIAELIAGIRFGRLDDLEFLAFAGAWVASVFPGIVVSRTTLRTGGIDPDAEP
jgi:hypothetical protein